MKDNYPIKLIQGCTPLDCLSLGKEKSKDCLYLYNRVKKIKKNRQKERTPISIKMLKLRTYNSFEVHNGSFFFHSLSFHFFCVGDKFLHNTKFVKVVFNLFLWGILRDSANKDALANWCSFNQNVYFLKLVFWLCSLLANLGKICRGKTQATDQFSAICSYIGRCGILSFSGI